MSDLLSRAAVLLAAIALAAGTIDRNREYRSSLTLAETVVERYPSSVGHHVLATELIAAGRRDEALAQLQQALPGDPRAHYTLGVLFVSDSRWDEAIRELSEFVREVPLLFEARQARIMLGKALAKKERWAEAIDEFHMVLSMNPSKDEQVDVLTASAIAYLATGRSELALPLFQQALAIDPANYVLEHNLANALFDTHDLAGAAAHARRALALRTDDAQARDLLDQILALQRASANGKRPA